MATARVLDEVREAHKNAVPAILSDRPLSATVWELAWPAVVVNLIQTVNMFVDRKFVGDLGTHALAANGFGGQITFLMMSVAFALGSATTALVARYYGAMEWEDSRKAMNQCVSLSIFFGLLCAVISYMFLNPVLDALMGANPDQVVRGETIAFLTPVILGVPAIFLINTLAGSLRAAGDTKTPMTVMIAMVIIHVATSWTFIFGHFGAPRMGIEGSGIGFSASLWAAVLIYIPIMARRRLGPIHNVQLPEWNWAKRILHLAWPTAIQTTARTTGMLAFTGILTRTAEGTVAVATLNIGIVAEGIAFMPGFGYAVAAAALVGQSLGAGVPDRGERATWIAMYQACAIMTAMGAFLFFGASWFAHLFSSDPAVIKCSITYLRIAAISEPFLAVGMVCMMGLQGAGDVFRAAWIAIISMWVLRLPLAYVLSIYYGGGATGAWWAMTIATVLSGVLAAYVFRSGKWKTARV